MPLSEPLRKIFAEAMHQCEVLETQNEALQMEIELLRSNLPLPQVQVQAQTRSKERDSTIVVSIEEKLLEHSPKPNAINPQYMEAMKNHNNMQTLPSIVVEEVKSTPSANLVEWSTNSISLERVRSRQATPTEVGESTAQHRASRVSTMHHRRRLLSSRQKLYNIESLFMLFKEFFLSTKFFVSPETQLTLAQRIEQGICFKGVCILMILLNVLYIALDSHIKAKNQFRRFEDPPLEPEKATVAMEAIEVVFIVWFLFELVFRALAEKKAFIFGGDRYWNMFDAFLVITSVVEKYLLSSFLNLSFMRIFRVFRLVRVVRVVRTVGWLQNLRTMVFSMMNSFISLMWAFCFIWLILLVFGIIFVNAVVDYVEHAEGEEQIATAKTMKLYFGSLYETMISLAASVTGGSDWMQYGELLRQLSDSDVFFWIYLFFIFFMLIGLMNVVTGIFVDSAVCTRTEDEVVANFKDDQKRTQQEFIRIFKEADADGSGTLTYDELEEHLEDTWVQAYFSGLDLDPSAAFSMFNLMDTSEDGTVDIDEFVDGCLKLKGHARSIDVMSIMYDNAKFFERFDQLNGQVVSIHEELRTVVSTLQEDRRHFQGLRGTARALTPQAATQPRVARAVRSDF